MVNDKDIDDVLALLPVDAVYYFTQPHTSRALSVEAMYGKWMALHPEHWASRCYKQAQEALRLAQSEASSADIIFVGGSNYLVGELLT
jgi:dihydrofolate synthase/folylpolyglutamate synthase